MQQNLRWKKRWWHKLRICHLQPQLRNPQENSRSLQPSPRNHRKYDSRARSPAHPPPQPAPSAQLIKADWRQPHPPALPVSQKHSKQWQYGGVKDGRDGHGDDGLRWRGAGGGANYGARDLVGFISFGVFMGARSLFEQFKSFFDVWWYSKVVVLWSTDIPVSVRMKVYEYDKRPSILRL